MTRTLKSDAVIQLNLKLLGLGISESLKQSGSSRSRIFFKVGSLKKFAIFTGNTCVRVSFLKICRPESL